MKKLFQLIIFFLLPFLSMAQDGNPPYQEPPSISNVPFDYPNNFSGSIRLNYVRTIEPSLAVDAAGLADHRGMARALEKTTYLDGYMRPLQVVIKKPVNNITKDLIKFYNYDASGRIADDMLPFVKTDRSLAEQNKFDKNVQSDHATTFANLGYNENYRFSRNIYEQSLPGRLLETQGPGAPWTGSQRGVQSTVRAGNQNDNVTKYAIGFAANIPSASGYHDPSELIVSIVTDEDAHVSKQFHNLEGLLLADEKDGLRTRYVYDTYSRLRCIIPPSVGSQPITQDVVDGLCFRYDYNENGELTRLKKPGAGHTLFRYDLEGRVILSQDAVQRSEDKWIFYKYDAGGRLIQQGIYTGMTLNPCSEDPVVIATQSYYMAQLTYFINYLYNTKVYNRNQYEYAFQDAEVLLDYYFDNYSFIQLSAYDPATYLYSAAVGNATGGYDMQKVNAPEGMLTGIRSAVSDGSTWIMHVNYYNSESQLIQTVSNTCNAKQTISANGYDFRGNLTKNIFQNTDVTIQKEYVYDTYSRLRYIKHKVGNATSFRQIAQFDYDDIGRLKSKKLGSIKYNEVYDYNIRNWITGINKQYCTNGGNGSCYFGEELFYETGFERRFYNGRLSGINWRSSGSKDVLRAYGYMYDANQRLTRADYNQNDNNGWSKDEKDFSTDIAYEKNGNIISMKHEGLNTDLKKTTIDDLQYTYESSGNKLLSVSDNSYSTDPDVHDGLGDFRDVTGEGNDYTYDVNGNLMSDANRNITAIKTTWFTLNKPLEVDMGNGNKIKYLYDATGNLLYKEATWDDSGFPHSNKIYYVGEIEYTGNELTLIHHDEGRIRPVKNDANILEYHYDYYLKDHLQNIRAIITETASDVIEEVYDPSVNPGSLPGPGLPPGEVAGELSPVMYIATSEPSNAPWEIQLFERVNETRGTRPADASPNDQYSATLSAASSRVVGPGKLIKVMAGDEVQLGAEAYYHSSAQPGAPVPINVLASQLISALSGSAAAGGEISNVFSQAILDPVSMGMALNNIQGTAPDDTTAPAAYLNYLVFDEGFNLKSSQSGAIQLHQAEYWQHMDLPKFQLAESGYLYVFTSNQSQATVNTDNLYIYHWKSALLEEFHYYPYGLTFEVTKQYGLAGSNMRYNTQSIERDEFTSNNGDQKYGLNWYDFMARSYDVQIGRWMQQDPMMQHMSPYLAMGNNPSLFTDPLGLTDGIPLENYGVNGGGFWGSVRGPDWWRMGYSSKAWMDSDFQDGLWEAQFFGREARGPAQLPSVKYGEDVAARNRQLDKEDAERRSLEADLEHYTARQVFAGDKFETSMARDDIKRGSLDATAYQKSYNRIADINTSIFFGFMPAFTFLRAAKTGVKYSDDLVKAAQKLYPNKAGKIELHHITPKYLGGAKNGPLVPLDASYHQVITNEFRALWPYGKGVPSATELQNIMKQVYSKYPLPTGY